MPSSEKNNSMLLCAHANLPPMSLANLVYVPFSSPFCTPEIKTHGNASVGDQVGAGLGILVGKGDGFDVGDNVSVG